MLKGYMMLVLLTSFSCSSDDIIEEKVIDFTTEYITAKGKGYSKERAVAYAYSKAVLNNSDKKSAELSRRFVEEGGFDGVDKTIRAYQKVALDYSEKKSREAASLFKEERDKQKRKGWGDIKSIAYGILKVVLDYSDEKATSTATEFRSNYIFAIDMEYSKEKSMGYAIAKALLDYSKEETIELINKIDID